MFGKGTAITNTLKLSQTESVLNLSHIHIVNIMQSRKFRPESNINCNEGKKPENLCSLTYCVCVLRIIFVCDFHYKYM
jgi:hypothetical protein